MTRPYCPWEVEGHFYPVILGATHRVFGLRVLSVQHLSGNSLLDLDFFEKQYSSVHIRVRGRLVKHYLAGLLLATIPCQLLLHQEILVLCYVICDLQHYLGELQGVELVQVDEAQ
jgi:hypothetical protein